MIASPVPPDLVERARRATSSPDPREREHAHKILRQAVRDAAMRRLRLAEDVIENSHGDQIFPEAVVVRDDPPPPRRGRLWLFGH